MTENKIITRSEAIALGLKRYFTGEPCKYGHVAERKVSNRDCLKCKVCRKKRARENRDEHLEFLLATDPDAFRAAVDKRRERDRGLAAKQRMRPEYQRKKSEWQRARRKALAVTDPVARAAYLEKKRVNSQVSRFNKKKRKEIAERQGHDGE